MSETPSDPYGSSNPPGDNPYGNNQPAGNPYGSNPDDPAGYSAGGYGQPGYGAAGPYGHAPAPDHPQSTTVLVLGILGLVLCQILAPFAWIMGKRVVGEIDASGGSIGGRSSANAGRICGIIGTVLIGLSILFLIGFIVLVVIAGAGSSSDF